MSPATTKKSDGEEASVTTTSANESDGRGFTSGAGGGFEKFAANFANGSFGFSGSMGTNLQRKKKDGSLSC